MDITLANTGIDSASYNLSWTNYRMTFEGVFEEIPEPDSGQFFANPHLRYFPRMVHLAPGETQKVKVQLYRPQQLSKGEYRSHMMFRAIKPAEPLGTERETHTTDEIVTKLILHYAITIPVILEIGSPKVTATLQQLELIKSEDGETQLSFIIGRKGDKSLYGNVIVTHIGESGKTTEVGIVKGLAVYVPMIERKFTLKLNSIAGINFDKGKLLLEYLSQTKGNPIWAKEELVL
jgi:hypothetical protein